MTSGITPNQPDKNIFLQTKPSISDNANLSETKLYQLGPYLLSLSVFTLNTPPLKPDAYTPVGPQASNLSSVFNKCLSLLGFGPKFGAREGMTPEAFLHKLQALELSVQMLRKSLSKDSPEFERLVHLLLKDVANFIKLFAPLPHNEQLHLLRMHKDGTSAEKLLHKLEQNFFSIQHFLPEQVGEQHTQKVISQTAQGLNETLVKESEVSKQAKQETSKHDPVIIRDKHELAQKAEMLHQQILNKTIPVPLNNILVSFPMNKNAIGETKTEAKKNTSSDDEGDEDETAGCGQEKQMQMALIPAGPVLIGNSDKKKIEIETFLISVHPITNLLYARWLTEQVKKGAFSFHQNGDLINSKEELICKTQSSDPLSQIQLQVKNGVLRVEPLPGAEMHPVVCVTFIGAEAFCQDNGFRLPSEEEWERAAGMDPENNERKYLFGCRADAIDPRYANYAEIAYDKSEGNLTTPVGFFNGNTSFVRRGRSFQSKDAVSPFGCYDMCGNVSSWTISWFDAKKTLKVTKGGHYASSMDALAVNARRPRHFRESDGFTGFRVVMSKE